MKKILILTIASIALLVSCSEENVDLSQNQNQGYVINTVRVPISQETGKVIITDSNAKIEPTINEYFYSEVTLIFFPDRKFMSAFSNTQQMINYIKNNPKLVYGLFQVHVDGGIACDFTVVAGFQTISRMYMSNSATNGGDGKYPCTFPGIKKCAIDRIHALNWYDKFLCITAGLGCVQNMYISCTIDNCDL